MARVKDVTGGSHPRGPRFLSEILAMVARQKSARREETQEFAISQCDNARRGGPSGEIRGGESWERNNEARPRAHTHTRDCALVLANGSERERDEEGAQKGGNAVGEREEAREEEEEARKRGRGEGMCEQGARGAEGGRRRKRERRLMGVIRRIAPRPE